MKNLLKSKKLDMRFKANKGINRKTKVAGILTILLFVFVGLFQLGIKIAEWFDTHKIIKQQVIQLQVQAPLRIETREPQVVEIVKTIENIPAGKDLETDVEKYIYEVFGPEDYKIAIAIAKAESGLGEHKINAYNTNGTVDIGVFQINSIHYNKPECSLDKIVTMKGNVDCAYTLYKASGWNPWVVFQNGSFKSKLD